MAVAMRVAVAVWLGTLLCLWLCGLEHCCACGCVSRKEGMLNLTPYAVVSVAESDAVTDQDGLLDGITDQIRLQHEVTDQVQR